jgi:pilus assembly protein CpaB
MKILKNRYVVGTACIVLGLLIGFVAIPGIQRGSGNATVSVIRAKQYISEQSEIMPEMLETVQVPRNSAPKDVLSALPSGSYAAAPIYAGDYLTKSKLAGESSALNGMEKASAKGLRVVSVTLPSLASGVSGRLEPGDIVSVLSFSRSSGSVTPGDASASAVALVPELQYLEVAMISTADGADALVQSSPSEENKNALPVTISFFATEDQARLLADLEQTGILHLVFVARGDDAAAYLSDDLRVLK